MARDFCFYISLMVSILITIMIVIGAIIMLSSTNGNMSVNEIGFLILTFGGCARIVMIPAQCIARKYYRDE